MLTGGFSQPIQTMYHVHWWVCVLSITGKTLLCTRLLECMVDVCIYSHVTCIVSASNNKRMCYCSVSWSWMPSVSNKDTTGQGT